MSSLRHLSIALLYCSAAVGYPLVLQAQTVTPQGDEFPLLEAAAVRGDQVWPQVSVGSGGGYVVWQDNTIDGSGLGIGARWLDSTLGPGLFGSFRVNQQATGDQENPSVAMLASGGAAIVWQGGRIGGQNIFVRFLTPGRTFSTSTDLRVNVYTNGPQSHPLVAALRNGNVVVVWCSDGQDGSMQGVYGRVINTNSQFISTPFQINQFTTYNQRNPSVSVLSNGNFVVTWVSEQQRLLNTADIMGRIYTPAGAAVANEFLVSTGDQICGSSAVAASASGGFTACWAQRTRGNTTDGWDIFARAFASDGTSGDASFRVNAYTYGDQFNPKLTTLGTNQLVVWTSLEEDGSLEGVFGQLLYGTALSGQPFQINERVINKQFEPALAADGSNRFMVVWSGFLGFTNGFDLFARRYAAGEPLPTPAAPFVSALSSSQLGVSWPALVGFPINSYEVYMDGAVPPDATAVVANGNYWTQGGLSPGTTHTFKLAYMFSGGARSELSAPASARTWGADITGRDGVPDGLPDDWEGMYFGVKAALWPSATADSDGDGASNIKEFLAGTNPLDPNSLLKMSITWSRFGRRLSWNTQPGFVYQVQISTDLSSWADSGLPRFAAGTSDSVLIAGARTAEYYRVLRLR